MHQTYSTSSWTRVPDERMKSFGCDGIDNESESVRNEVFQVRTCPMIDWLVEFNNNVDAEKNLYSMKDNSLIKDVAAMTSIESDEQDILQKVDEISQKADMNCSGDMRPSLS